MANTKQLRVSLSEKDDEHLKAIASKLGLKESEVMKKGLQLMALYLQSKEEEGKSLVLQDKDNDKDILIL